MPVDVGNIKERGEGGISYNFREGRPYGDPTPERRHAGLDIHTKANSPVRAVTDGIIVEQREFPMSGSVTVYQVIVLNFDGSVIRYCELQDRPIDRGTIVRQGDIIGYTKKMTSSEMLHIEVYSNADEYNQVFAYNLSRDDNGKYSNVTGNNFIRRSDLINPTMFGALGVYQGDYEDLT